MFNQKKTLPISLLFLITIVSVFALSYLSYFLAPVFLVMLFFRLKQKENLINFTEITFFLFLMSLIISYFTSINKCNTEYEILKIILLFPIYLIFKHFLRDASIRRSFILLFCLVLIVVFLLNLFFLLSFSAFFQLAGFNELVPFRDAYRPFGIIINDWNGVLFLFLLLIIFCVAEFNGSKNTHTFLFILLGGVCFLIITTFSRAGLFSLLFIIAFSIMFLPKKLLLKNYKPMLIIASFIGLSLIIFSKDIFTTLSLFETTSQKLSFDGRISIWGNSLNILRDNYFLGTGSGNFPLAARINENVIRTNRISNSFLQILIENGIVGLTMFIIFIFILLISSIKRYIHSKNVLFILFPIVLSGFFIREFFFNSLFVNFIVLLLFTISLAYYNSLDKQKDENFNYSDKFIYLMTVPLVVIGCMLGININQASRLNDKGLNFVEEGNYSESIFHFKEASRCRPGNAVFYSNTATAYERLYNKNNGIQAIINHQIESDDKFLDSALVYLNKALKINRFDDAFLHNLGWVHYMKGDFAKAKKYFDLAIQYDPTVAYYYISRGFIWHFMNEKDSLLNDFSTALEMAPILYESTFFSIIDSLTNDKKDFLDKAINKIITDTNKSPINLAKLGKLVLYKDTLLAQKYLEKAIVELPNLNRCYLYLGNIYEFKYGEYLKAEDYYYKSFCLDPSDIIVHKNLCRYYLSISKQQDALKYCNMKQNIKNKSIHNLSVKALYKTKIIDDDIFPSGFFDMLYLR